MLVDTLCFFIVMFILTEKQCVFKYFLKVRIIIIQRHAKHHNAIRNGLQPQVSASQNNNEYATLQPHFTQRMRTGYVCMCPEIARSGVGNVARGIYQEFMRRDLLDGSAQRQYIKPLGYTNRQYVNKCSGFLIEFDYFCLCLMMDT